MADATVLVRYADYFSGALGDSRFACMSSTSTGSGCQRPENQILRPKGTLEGNSPTLEMASQTLGLIAPLATTLPDPSPKEVLTDAQWTTLLAIAETVVPRASRASQTKEKNSAHMSETEYNALVNNVKATLANPPEESILVEYLGESATTHENFRQELHRTLAQHVRYDAVKGIAFILNTLKYASVGCTLTGPAAHERGPTARQSARWYVAGPPCPFTR